MTVPALDELDARTFRLAALGCVLLAVAAAYANAFDAALLFDSVRIVRDDVRLRAWEWASIRRILLDDYWYGLDSNLYRPLTTLSYAVNHSLLGGGAEPGGYVAVNAALHAAAALLVVALARVARLGRAVALLGGLVFAVHPLHTEAVTNVVGRADVLAAVGVLAGLWVHARIAARDGPAPWLSAALACASAVAIGAKESGIVLVGVLLLHDLVLGRSGTGVTRAGAPGQRGAAAAGARASAGAPGAAAAGARVAAWGAPPPLGRLLRERLARSYLWCLGPVALWLALRSVAFAGGANPPSIADNPLLMLDAVPARVTAAAILLRYVALLVWPARLSADYSFDALPLFDGSVRAASDVLALLAVVVVAGALAAGVALRRRAPAASFLLLFAFVAVAPVSNVFVRIGTILAERLAYLPSAGLLVLASWGLVALFRTATRGLATSRRAAVGTALALLLLVALGARTRARNDDWRSGVALFGAAVEVSPGSFKAHKSLAGELALAAADERELHAQVDTILAHAGRAWEIMQRLPPRVGYAELLADLAFYQRVKAAAVAPEQADAWRARAEETYRTALRWQDSAGNEPSWRIALGLAEVLRDRGRHDEALAAFAHALPLAPGPEVLAPYAELLDAAGRGREALLAALRLVTLQPAHPGAWSIIAAHYARTHPGELTVSEASGRWLFNAKHAAVAADLREAARRQYEDLARLGPERGAGPYRESVLATLGFDPADAAPAP